MERFILDGKTKNFLLYFLTLYQQAWERATEQSQDQTNVKATTTPPPPPTTSASNHAGRDNNSSINNQTDFDIEADQIVRRTEE
jgi:hypothetical protein